MKKTAILLIILSQAVGLNAWSFFKSSSEKSVSDQASVSSEQGGAVRVGDTTYELKPGQTLAVSQESALESTIVQEPGQEPVETTVIEQGEPEVTIDGAPAQEVEEIEKAEADDFDLDAKIEAALDFGDGYSS